MVKSRRTFALVVKYLVVTVVCAVMIYPLLWMLSSSFKEEFYIFKEPVSYTHLDCQYLFFL